MRRRTHSPRRPCWSICTDFSGRRRRVWLGQPRVHTGSAERLRRCTIDTDLTLGQCSSLDFTVSCKREQSARAPPLEPACLVQPAPPRLALICAASSAIVESLVLHQRHVRVRRGTDTLDNRMPSASTSTMIRATFPREWTYPTELNCTTLSVASFLCDEPPIRVSSFDLTPTRRAQPTSSVSSTPPDTPLSVRPPLDAACVRPQQADKGRGPRPRISGRRAPLGT